MQQKPLHRREITDPDVRMLAAIAATLAGDYKNAEQEAAWAGSPFNWIRQRPSRQRGKIGEQLVAGSSPRTCSVNMSSVTPRNIGVRKAQIPFGYPFRPRNHLGGWGRAGAPCPRHSQYYRRFVDADYSPQSYPHCAGM